MNSNEKAEGSTTIEIDSKSQRAKGKYEDEYWEAYEEAISAGKLDVWKWNCQIVSLEYKIEQRERQAAWARKKIESLRKKIEKRESEESK